MELSRFSEIRKSENQEIRKSEMWAGEMIGNISLMQMGEVPANVQGWHRQDYNLEPSGFAHISCVGDNLKQIRSGQLRCPKRRGDVVVRYAQPTGGFQAGAGILPAWRHMSV